MLKKSWNRILRLETKLNGVLKIAQKTFERFLGKMHGLIHELGKLTDNERRIWSSDG